MSITKRILGGRKLENTQRWCSFCGKERHEVFYIIMGPGGVGICDECVELCVDVVRDERQKRALAAATSAGEGI